MSGLGGFTAAAAKVVLGVESEGYTTQLNAAEAEFSQAVGSMGARTAELSERQIRGAVASDRYVTAIGRYGPASVEARASLANLITEHRKLAEVQEQAALSSTKLQRSLEKSASGGKLMSGAMSLATNAFLGGAGFVYAVHSAVTAASRFQGEMTLLQTQALKTHAEVEKMTIAVKKMAPALATSPDALAKGLYHVESAGYSGAKALDVLTVAAKGARLGHSDLEATTNALVAAQKSGVKGAGNLSQAMGVLDAIVGSSNTRMEDLAKGLSSGVLSAAAGAGVSLAQLGGAFATLTIQGTPAELAMTRLRYAIALISAQTPKAEKTLRGIGISATELGQTLATKGLVPALSLLKTKMEESGKTAVEQQQVLERAFGGGRSYTTILTLYRSLDQVNKLTKEIDAQGIGFGARWEAQTKTAEYAFARLGAAADVLKIQVGDALLPPTVGAAEGVSKWLENASNQKRVTSDIVQGFKDAKAAAEVFGIAMHQVGDVMHLTDAVLGGSGKTLKLFAEALLLLKLRGFAGSINTNLLQPLRGVQKEAQDAEAAIEKMAARPVDAAAARQNFVLPWNKQAENYAKIQASQTDSAKKTSTEIQTALTKTADVEKDVTDVTVASSTTRVTAAQQEADDVVAANDRQIASITEVGDAWAGMAAAMTGIVSTGSAAATTGSPFAPSIIPIPATLDSAAHVATQERLTAGLGKFTSNDPVDQAMILAATRLVRANELAGKPPLNTQDLREALSAGGGDLAALAKVTTFNPSDYGGEARVANPTTYDPLGALSFVPPNKRGGTRGVPSAITEYVAKNGPRPAYAQGSKAYYADIAAQMGITTAQAKSLVRQYETGSRVGTPYAGSNETTGQRQVPEARLGSWAEIPAGLTEAQMTALMGELAQRGLVPQQADPYASMAARDRAATAARVAAIRPTPIRPTYQNRVPKGQTYQDLYNEAHRLNIPGRSSMSKAQLQDAIAQQQVMNGLLTGQRADTVPTVAASERSDDAFHRMRRIREAQPAEGFQTPQEAAMAGVGSFVETNGLPGSGGPLRGAAYYSSLAKQLGVTREQAQGLVQQFVELAQAEETAAKAALTYRMDAESTLGGKLSVLQSAQQEAATAQAKLEWKQNLASMTPAGTPPGETWRLGVHPSQIDQLQQDAATKQAQLERLSAQYGQAQADAQARQVAGSKLLADSTRENTAASRGLNVELDHQKALLENQPFAKVAAAQKRLADGTNTLAGLTAKTSAATEKLTGVTRDMRLGLSSAAERVAMSWQDVTKEGEAAGLTEKQITSLMTAEQLRAKSLADLAVDEKFFDERLATEAGAYNEVTDSVTRLTDAQIRQNKLAADRAALGVMPGLSSGGVGILPPAAQTGLLARLKGNVKGLNGAGITQNLTNNAFGYGLGLSLFGSQIPGMLGIHGQTGSGISSTLTGAGTGLIFGQMLGIKNPYLAAGIGASFGVKHAIGGQKNTVRGNIGTVLGAGAEGAAGGALIGSVVPVVGTAVGAAVGWTAGLGLGLLKISSNGPKAASALNMFATASNKAAGAAARAKQAMQAGGVQLANDRVGRDQAKSALDQAKAEEVAARNTKGHQAAVDNLRAAQANYDASLRQIKTDLHYNEQAQLHLNQANEKAKDAQAKITGEFQKTADAAKDWRTQTVAAGRGIATATASATDRVNKYVASMKAQAEQLKASHPKLAQTALDLAQIATDANKIPDKKTIDIVVKFGLDTSGAGYQAFLGQAQAWLKMAEAGPQTPTVKKQEKQLRAEIANVQGLLKSGATYAGSSGTAPLSSAENAETGTDLKQPYNKKQDKSASTYSTYVDPGESKQLAHLDAEISDAQAHGKSVSGLQKQEIAWLWKDYAAARNDAQKKAVTDQINQIKSSIDSGQTKADNAAAANMVPQGLADELNAAKQSGSKTAELKAYQDQAKYLKQYLTKHPNGKLHKKANDLLSSIDGHIATLTKSVSGGVPPALYLRQQKALQNLATHPAGAVDKTDLEHQRAIVKKFLGEKGHDKTDRAKAEATLKKLNAEIKSGKATDYYTPAIQADQAIARYFHRQSLSKKNDLATRLKDAGLETKYDNAAAALIKKRDGTSGATGKYGAAFVPLEIAYQKALQTTGTKADDIKALTAEQRYLKNFITDHPGKGALQLAANKLLASIDTKLSGLHKTLNLQLQQMEAQFLQEQQNIQDQYASNVYTPGSGKVDVNVHQYFPHPPTDDGHREAIYARQAALAHFDS